MRSTSDWRGKTDDTPIPDYVKVRVFERFGGICPKCTRKMQPGKWDCDHVIALVNGGGNCEGNLQPLCTSPCHSAKTKADVAEKSRVYQRKKSHLLPKRPKFRGWKNMRGEPVHASRER